MRGTQTKMRIFILTLLDCVKIRICGHYVMKRGMTLLLLRLSSRNRITDSTDLLKTLCLCASVVAILLLSSNCTTLRPPAITFTQSQTAAERQMIGEGKDLEKDGWIISSIRTSASGSDIWEKEILDKEIPEGELDETTYTALKRLAYLAKDLRDYKKKDFVGEALDGQVKINPLLNESRFKKQFPDNRQKIEDLLKMVNESRKVIYENKITKLSEQNLKEQELLKRKENYLLVYYQTVEDGEYYELKRGKWGRKE